MSRYHTPFEIHVHGDVPLREDVAYDQIQEALKPLWQYAGARSLAAAAENGLKQEDDEFSVGVAVPYGNFEFSAGYAYSKSKTAGVTQAKGSAYALGATYALSKRTKVYAAYLDGDVENGAGTKTADKRVYAAGIRHDF